MSSEQGSPSADRSCGRLAENLMLFARTLRAAGLPVGPGSVLTALEAVRVTGLSRRDDFYWTLFAVFVSRREHREIFDQAFHLFWRNPKMLERMMRLLLPEITVPRAADQESVELGRRVLDAIAGQKEGVHEVDEDKLEIEVDASHTWSDREVLRTLDFESMSSEELALARKAIAGLRLPIQQVTTRRFRCATRGRTSDLRASLRASLRSGSATIPLRWKERRRRHPPLVILCDISGSMDRYSRMLLHFLHAVTNDRDRVHSFLFGTRLSNVTRHLRHKDVDLALDRIAANVEDWSGGTRIATCLADFNANWSRRVLGQGALVLMITDGLDRDGRHDLGAEMERLHKSCRSLIWLNPLLRYDRYEPRARGAQAMLPHVDHFCAAHNLASLEELTALLSRPLVRRQEGVTQWLEAM